MSITSPSVTQFCWNRIDPEKANRIIQANKKVGLSDREGLNQALKEGEYVPVIASIWAERNKEIRLNFLREKSCELHAPLMFEHGLAEFNAEPTVDTFINITMPLFIAARFRVMQDAKCSKDITVEKGDPQDSLLMVYTTSLGTSIKKHLNSEYSQIIKENNNEVQVQTRLKVLQVAEQTLTQELPNPGWLASHGMAKFFGTTDVTHTPADCSIKRVAYAKKILENKEK